MAHRSTLLKFAACLFAIVTFATGTCQSLSVAEEKSPADSKATETNSPLFESHILPILKAKCARCHGEKTRKSELDLSSAKGVFRGSESGAIIEPGKPEESSLYEMVHEGYMPPEDEKPRLTKSEIHLIEVWIKQGAKTASGKPTEIAANDEAPNQHTVGQILRLRCTACHGPQRQESDLDLRTRESILKGGKHGPAMVLGKPDESPIIKVARSGEMPPNKRLIEAGVKPISKDEIAVIARWIELGAPTVELEADVATGAPDPLVTDKDREFWSFQPPKAHEPPSVKTTAHVRNPIDAFVLAKLEAKDLSFSPEANKLTLLRRAYFDLIGLPPTPEETQAFLADDSKDAYEKLIDRLLQSPHYGERWGRFWLDLAGYADSEGKRSADPVRPNAWRYRDYVIRAFNEDKPYDRFLTEQLAGDELANYEDGEITPEIVDNLVATGFLRMAPDGTGSDIVNFVPERLEVISDEIDIFSSVVLGLTMKCARCHSHKYDPIPQRDYYRLMAVFKGAYDEHDWLKPSSVPGQTKGKRPGRMLAHFTSTEQESVAAHNDKLEQQRLRLQKQIDDFAARLRNEHLEAQLPKLPKVLHEDLRKVFATPKADRNEVQKYLADKFEKTLWLTKSQLNESDREYRAESKRIERAIKELNARKQKEPRIRALWDRGQPSPTYIYKRGDYLTPGRLVGPGVPSVLSKPGDVFEIEPPWEGAKQTGRRLALAKWLTSRDHPLTSRVMINRIWQFHFGQGLVKSASNFGKTGTRPSHPELLDWLAVNFVEGDWSIKRMHRLMMTSQTYRQTSQMTDVHEKHDPENVLLSRMPLKRMDAEVLRDSILFVSGKLDDTRFGPPDQVDARKDGLVTAVATDKGWRRSIYVLQRRKTILSMLEAFDLPQMNPNCTSRPTSTVASQALHLMNDTQIRKLSEEFAARVKDIAGEELARQIETVYQFALSRPPSSRERELGRETLLALRREWANAKQLDDAKAANQALSTYCHTIFNSAGFLYID